MRVLVISDVHGNLVALERLFTFEASNFDYCICLGDVVNYGPWSNECVEFMEFHKIKVLKGNHEEFFIKGYCDSSNEVCKQAFNKIKPGFMKVEQIANYSDEFACNDFLFKHTIDNKYIYADTDLILNKNLFIGHSHHQFSIKKNGFVLYNVGSVGQNRKNIEIINYALLNDETGFVELKSLDYKISPVIKEFQVQKFPSIVIDYYRSKIKK